MKKLILTTGFGFVVLFSTAQIKVHSDKQVMFGSTSATPTYLIDLYGGTDNDVNTGASNGYRINSNYVLRNNNNVTDIFVGVNAGNSTMSNHYNTAVGNYAGNGISTGSLVCTYGYKAGYTNTSGNYSTLIGTYSGGGATLTGGYNTFLGYGTGYNTTSGVNNVIIGHNAGYNNQSGPGNTFCGYEAGKGSGTSSLDYNSFFGMQAGYATTTGDFNVAVGKSAGATVTTGSNNTFLGYNADICSSCSTYTNSTAIGNGAVVPSNINSGNYVRIGNSSVQTSWVQVDWTIGSDKRIKNNIKHNVPGIAFIKMLKPATFHYDIHSQNSLMGYPSKTDSAGNNSIDTSFWQGKYDIEKTQFTGFVAQEVDSAAQVLGFNFSGIDKSSEVMGLRYSSFVVPLVKAVQEQQIIIDNLTAEVSSLKIGGQKTIQSNNAGQDTMAEEIKQLKKEINALKAKLNAIEKTK